MTTESIRLQKWLADAGLCSRREGERWITAGRVKVNGVLVTNQGSKVGPGDRVWVDGKRVVLRTMPKQIILMHKPRGLLCTRKDEQGRPTIFDLLQGTGLPRMVSVGRLDYNSEGLLLLTDDGHLAHGLTHPSRKVPRVYRVRVHGRVDEALLGRLRRGVTLDDGPTGPLDVVSDRLASGANSWLTMTLYEGRNRMIRRIFQTIDMEVSRLIRTSYGMVELGDLAERSWRLASPEEKILLQQFSSGQEIGSASLLERLSEGTDGSGEE
ncbi:MAG: rRNA pseudouridine synthase [Magnetococcus sp. DMHC-6]